MNNPLRLAHDLLHCQDGLAAAVLLAEQISCSFSSTGEGAAKIGSWRNGRAAVLLVSAFLV